MPKNTAVLEFSSDNKTATKNVLSPISVNKVRSKAEMKPATKEDELAILPIFLLKLNICINMVVLGMTVAIADRCAKAESVNINSGNVEMQQKIEIFFKCCNPTCKEILLSKCVKVREIDMREFRLF